MWLSWSTVTQMGGACLSNRWRARSLRTRPHKTVTLIMVGLFTTEATIKIKHFRREELNRMEKRMFLATVADGQPAAFLWGEGRKAKKTHLQSAFGWVLPSLSGPLGARWKPFISWERRAVRGKEKANSRENYPSERTPHWMLYKSEWVCKCLREAGWRCQEAVSHAMQSHAPPPHASEPALRHTSQTRPLSPACGGC